MAATTIKFQQFRHLARRTFARTRRAKKLLAWLGAKVTTLTGTGTGTIFTVNPTAVAATGVITLTGQPGNTETVTIDGQVYTFETSLTDAPNFVLIGGTASLSLDNLIAAINNAAGEGSTYGTGTLVHASVSAAAGAGDTIDITALVAGLNGNSIAMSETLTLGTVTATLTGGENAEGGNATTHGFVTGDGPFTLSTVTTLPAGLSLDPARYWVIVDDADNFRFATSLEAAQAGLGGVDITDAGTGAHTMTLAAEAVSDIFELLKKNRSETIEAATDRDALV